MHHDSHHENFRLHTKTSTENCTFVANYLISPFYNNV